jgi:hypothetical protein
MRHEDDFIGEWRTTRVDKSRPPLRWIANLAGSIASRGLLDISYMEDNDYKGWKYKVNLFLWDNLYPIYNKYGTFYEVDFGDEDEYM